MLLRSLFVLLSALACAAPTRKPEISAVEQRPASESASKPAAALSPTSALTPAAPKRDCKDGELLSDCECKGSICIDLCCVGSACSHPSDGYAKCVSLPKKR